MAENDINSEDNEIKEEKKEEEINEVNIEPNDNEENNDKKALQLKQIEFDELNDRYKRVMAEFENFKKRSQKERESLYNSVLGDIISGMLPAIDNLENAVKAECKDENYKQGVELVQKQFIEFLEKNNVHEIPSVGETFDPSVHEAVGSTQDPEKGVQEIVQEYRKGYKIGSKVIRHSMVVVAN